MSTNLVAQVLAVLPGARPLPTAAETIRDHTHVDRVSITAIVGDRYEVLAHAGDELLPAGASFALETSTHFERASTGDEFESEDFLSDRVFRKPLDQLVVSSGFRSGLSVPMSLGNRVVGALSLTSADYSWEPTRYQRFELEAAGALLASHVLGDGWTAPTSVLIAHGDPLVAAGIRDLLGSQSRATTTVVGDAAELASAVRATKPDVVVIGEDFGDGRVLATVMAECAWHPPVVFLAPRDAPAARIKAGDVGASAFVLHARAAAQLSQVISSLLLKTGVDPEFRPPASGLNTTTRLTRRERDLLLGLDSGRSLREIARDLGVSETTLKGYGRDLYRKLDAHSRGEAVFVARERGLLAD